MSQTIVIVLLACGQALAQSTGVLKLPKAAPKSKFPAPVSHKQRLPPPSAFAPAFAPVYAPEITTKDLDSGSLPSDYYDALALAPGVKERYAQKAIEDVFTPKAPVFSDTSQASGGASGFAPEYAPAYAPSFFGSATKGATVGFTPSHAASAYAHSTYSEHSGGASGFAPEYAPAYAPSFFGSARKGATVGFTPSHATPAYAPPNDFTASAYAPQVAHSTYSEPSGGKTSGFAPLFAPAYAPTFFGSPKESSGFASAYAAPSASFSAPAYAPQGVAARPSSLSESSGGKVSGFAPLFAPEYAPAFFGSPRDVAAAAHSGAPVSSFSASAYAPPVAARQFASSSSTGSTSKASGFAPLFAPSYSSGFFGKPKVMDLDATQTSSNLLGTLAMALMGISISGIFVAVVRLRRKASTSLEEAYVPAPV